MLIGGFILAGKVDQPKYRTHEVVSGKPRFSVFRIFLLSIKSFVYVDFLGLPNDLVL